MKKLLLLALVVLGGVFQANADNYLKGSWDNWNATAHMFVFDGGIGTVTISNLSANTSYEFGIQDGNNYYSYNGSSSQITSDNCLNWILYTNNSNTVINTKEAGDYTFKLKWVNGNPQLSVVYPTSEPIVVHFKNNSWNSVYAYRYFYSTDICDTKWPGTALSQNADNSDYYDVIFSDSFNRITFSDNGSNTNKSGDVTIDFSATEYWVTDNATATTTAPEGWVGYTRNVTAGNFGTICLPYAATVSGATVYKIVSTVGSGSSMTGINLEAVESLEAGHAYIFKATGSTLTATYSGTYANAIEADGMLGNLASDPVTVASGNYVVSGNKICPVGSNVTIGQNRAYITLNGISAAASRGANFIGFEEATGIENIQAENAQNVVYNLQGQRVTDAQKGLVIVGGKKMLRK